METDQLTLRDLSILGSEDSLVEKLNATLTLGGKSKLQQYLSQPLSSIEKILEVQDVLKTILKVHEQWPTSISNGTILVIEKFLESALDPIPQNPTTLSTRMYKILHGPDFSLAMYSINHVSDLIGGLNEIIHLLNPTTCPAPLRQQLERATDIISNSPLKMLLTEKKLKDWSKAEKLKLAYHVRFSCKHKMMELIQIFSTLDAWYGMSAAVIQFKLVFPVIEKTEQPYVVTKGLYHLLLDKPVPYAIELNKEKNFMFLTGANMAGKSTFIKSLGTAVFLAHTGMAVPAESMKLSYFDGLISNINISDNIQRGESYFYNEVKRIRATVEKISNGKNWLILIDELFKGTNIEDAMKCTQTVVEGLAKSKHSVFILSTHLYEIATSLQQHTNIDFRYFETEIKEGQFNFSYQLREGISNDRLGYLILSKEGVVNLLKDIR